MLSVPVIAWDVCRKHLAKAAQPGTVPKPLASVMALTE